METTEKLKAIIDTCYECVTTCEICSTSCLNEEHVHMMVKCIKLSRDCADICRLTAALLARGSEHGMHLLEECAEICDACAAECEKHDTDWCKDCAKICRKCAAECRKDMPVEIM